jgi:WD40 repeat protein/serine/threonine protein kinase/tetratricopeptide (TPR) repeat protein
MTDSSSERNPVEELAEDFLARFRRGERPSLTEYTRQYPQWADEIRDLFPALVMMEDIRPDAGDPTGAFGTAAAPEARHLEQLGDYRILREVGRGGMGVVYEAEQVSLGRHVALKVLATQALLDPRHLQRFRREAKAAARLHHTNIVPVFGVGEADGLHYFVMQFIRGLGLDQVIAELRRLRRLRTAPPGDKPADAALPSPSELSAAAVAQALLTGEFGPAPATQAAARPPEPGGASLTEVPPGPRDLPKAGPGGPGSARLAGATAGDASGVGTATSSSVHLPGQAEHSTLSDSSRQYWQSVARVGVQVAEALAYAHAQGVLHRDIKPSNLLLDTEGTVWVTDFGLAKAADSDDLTHTGDIVGTLRYMPPERFGGQGDPRSDVYSLGLTLYELLTLRPAFDKTDRARLIQQMLHDEPPRPRKLNPAVPRDLETVVLKATARDPAHRYQSAAEMAEDLKRFVEDKPIRARRVSEVERLWRWCRRNPTMAGLAAALVLALLVGTALSTWKWREAEQRRAEAEDAKQNAVQTRTASQMVSANVLLDKGIALAEQGQVDEGLLWMLESMKAAPPDDGIPAGDPRAEEVRHFKEVARANLAAWLGHAPRLEQFISRPDFGLRCWAFRPDGKVFVLGFLRQKPRTSFAQLFDAATGESIGPPLPHDLNVEAAAFSPDGRLLVTGEWTQEHRPAAARRWDAATGRPLGPPLAHPDGIRAVAFSPDGREFATACQDGVVRFWDAAGRPTRPPLRHEKASARGLGFSSDGTMLLVGTEAKDNHRGAACCWDLATGKPIRSFPHPGPVRIAAFAPDGTKVLLAGEDGTAQLWDLSGHKVGRPLKARAAFHFAYFTPDGQAVVTRDQSGVTRWWDPATSQELVGRLSERGTDHPPHSYLALAADGRHLLMASGLFERGTARLWRLPRTRSRPVPTASEVLSAAPAPIHYVNIPGSGPGVAYSPDRATALTAEPDQTARLRDTGTGQPRGAPLRHPGTAIAFSPDGRVAVTTSGGAAHLVDAATGWLRAELPHGNSQVSALAFRPDSKVVATGGYDLAVNLWDTATGQRLGPPWRQPDLVLSLAFSPDGKTLAVGHSREASGQSGLVLWDVATRKQTGAIPDLSDRVEFSPDGKTLLASGAGKFRLLDPRTAKPRSAEVGTALIRRAAFSGDSRLLLTGTATGTVQVWDTATARPVGGELRHSTAVTAVAFSPDAAGRLLLVGCQDGSAWLWDRATAKPLGPPVLQGRPLCGVAFTPDGRWFLTTAVDGRTRRWPVPVALAGDLDRLAQRLQAHTGLKMGPGQVPVQLSAAEWQACRRKLAAERARGEGDADVFIPEADWHDARTRDAEQAGDAFAARWHLDRLVRLRPKDWLAYARRARTFSAAGEFDRAGADYERARQRASREEILNWYRHRITDGEGAGRWPAVLWYADRALALEPKDWQLYASRARAHDRLGQAGAAEADLDRAIELGADSLFLAGLADAAAARRRWERAAALYGKAAERGKLPLDVWLRYALVALQAGDRAAYRRTCARLVKGAGQTTSVAVANTAAWVCAVGPGGLDDYTRPVALAEYAVKKVPVRAKHGVLNTLGAVLYRAGRYQEAVKRLTEGIAAEKGNGLIQDWVFLAMAHHRLGQAGEARKWLAKVREHKPAGPEDKFTWDALEVELLRREAERVLASPGSEPGEAPPK